MKNTIKNKLPKNILRGLKDVKKGLVAMFLNRNDEANNNAGIRNSEGQKEINIASYLPNEINVENALKLVDALDALEAEGKVEDVDKILSHIILSPFLYRAYDLEFVKKKLSQRVNYKRICACLLYGQGNVNSAFDMFCELENADGRFIDAMMAARCLMRPHGNEEKLLIYLLSIKDKYHHIPLYYLNLATCYFVLNDTINANKLLEDATGGWEDYLKIRNENNISLHSELESALADSNAKRLTHYDNTIYTEHNIWDHWWPYYNDMNLHAPCHMFGWLNNAYISFLEEAISNDSNVNCVIDFGVMCAEPLFQLALKHKNIEFFGVDRQVETAKLNNFTYNNTDNLKFKSCEIEEFINYSTTLDNAILFHGRTATLCYPKKISNLYKLARNKGVKKIVLFENLSLTHYEGKFFDFDAFPNESIIFKNHQFIHNYKKMLNEAGFSNMKERRMFAPLVSIFDKDDICSTHVHIEASI